MNNVSLRVKNCNDDVLDHCDAMTVAVLRIGHTSMPLCLNCVNELQEYFNEFCRPQYCYQCENFEVDECGRIFGGTCHKKNEHKDCMDYCDEFAAKEN